MKPLRTARGWHRVSCHVALAAAFLSASLATSSRADDEAAVPNPALFQPGDRWSAVGDSITHGGLYHDFVYLYYVTRFPNRRFDMNNAGISGDTAEGTLRRFDWDVISGKPTVATVMLGMNDVGGYLYDQPATEKIAHDRQFLIDRYTTNLRTLVTKLKASGVRVILITPSPYDQTVAFDPATFPTWAKMSAPTAPGLIGKNDGLQILASRVRDIGREFKVPVVEFNAPMTTLAIEKQKTDPHFTLIGPDRTHPGPVGHFVMAYLLLKAQSAPRYVARLAIDARKNKVDMTDNCQVTDLKTTENGASFTLNENALPYPVSPSFAPAFDLVPFAAELNREPFVVTGFKPGKYTLKIDDRGMGVFDAAALAAGIDLASLSLSPQAIQSLAVRELDRKRNALLNDRLRSIAWVEFNYEKDGIAPGNKADKTTMDRATQLRDAEKTSYKKDMFVHYVEDKPREAELHADYLRATNAEWAAAKPTPHRFTLTRAE